MEKQMRCPSCNMDLTLGKKLRVFETLTEHVCDSNGMSPPRSVFVCINPLCRFGASSSTSRKSKHQPFWDRDGEIYGSCISSKDKQSLIGGDYSALNSWARKAYIEIQKHDEDFNILCTKWLKLRIEFSYTSDEEGTILSRKPRLQILLHRKGNIGFYYYISGVHMLIFCFKEFYRNLKWYRKDLTHTFYKKELEQAFDTHKNDKRWWGWLFYKYISTFHKNIMKEAI